MAQQKVIIITGASDGIGAAAARQLHQDGHQVVVVGRSPEKTKAVAREIGAAHFIADFTRLGAVRKLAADLDSSYPRIDVLANNAGGVFGGRDKTVDGFEKTFQINHLAPFLLTELLMDKLIASRASIIQTSSSGAWMGKLNLNDLNNDEDFNSGRAYCTAKLLNVLFTQELHRRYHARGISAAAFHPGTVSTNFATDTDSFIRYFVRFGRFFMRTPGQGADQLVWLSETVPGVDWVSGTFYEKRKVFRRIAAGFKILDIGAYQLHYITGPHKRFWSWSFLEAGPALLAQEALNEEQLNELADGMRAADEDPNVLVGHCRNHQLIACKPH
jgi:NAD(P)-dependent dehydrogenase (short-subunit alcohol dehydrogenase family)